MEVVEIPGPDRDLRPQAVVLLDPATGLPVAPGSASITGPLTVSGGAAAGAAPAHAPVSMSGVDAGGLKRHVKTDAAGNLGMYPASERLTATATIANAASVSGTVDLTGTALLGFVMPAAWTTAALNIDVSPDNVAWSSPYDTTPAAVSSIATPVVSAAYAVDMTAMLPWRFIRFRSGTAASPVNQGAARAIVCVTRPLA